MKWISDFIDIIFPRHCLVCNEILSKEEKDICLNCLVGLPLVSREELPDIEKSFWGIVPVEHAASYIYYRKGSPYNRLLHEMKYNDRPQIGYRLAVNAAKELIKDDFFKEIELIVPLPLSKKKLRKRGYNQSEYIARGLSHTTGIDTATDLIVRTIANETQTDKNREERWKNVDGIFSIINPKKIEGKHVLLVDDILTTGATIASCAKALCAAGCRVSIFTLAYTSNKFQ